MSDETTGPSPEEMGLTPEDMKIEKPETNPEKGVEIPTYNPDDQIKLKEGDDYLSVVGTEKTRTAREIDHKLRLAYEVSERDSNTAGGGPGVDTNLNDGEGLQWAVDNTNREVGIHFQGHGLAKDPVEDLDRLVNQGLSKDRTFYSMEFVYSPEAEGGLGAAMPKPEGGIIVLSDYDKQFPYEGDPQIKYILVDEQYMRVVDIMQERYAEHGVKVVPWHDVPSVLSEDYNSRNPGKEIQPLVSLDPASPPKYDYGPAKPPDSEKHKLDEIIQALPSDEVVDSDDPVW